ncbi:MAG: hypothetical protein EOM69_03590, partial [Clostridia bacterium]|nr:hypothetical protein [Clostridia bacterium]
MTVFRCFTEKRPGFDTEAHALCERLRTEEGVSALTRVRLFCRYDVEGIDAQTYALARAGVFSEPACDAVYD